MKTSNKILFITAIVIIIMLFVSVLGSRIFLNEHTDLFGKGQPSGDVVRYVARWVSTGII